MWQLTGKADNVTARCFCRVMHAFTWPTKGDGDEILDCDLLYQPEEDDEYPPLEPEEQMHDSFQDLVPEVPEIELVDPLAGLEALPE
ncbi:hypothetical protein D9M70_613430 [compost metagenome]